MGGAPRAAARQGRPLLPQASNPCPAHHMGTRRRSSFLEMGAACEGAVGVGEEPHMGTRRRSSFLEMGAACEGAVGVGEEPLEAREPRQCGRARNPSHGKGLRSSLVTDSGESRWSISASSSI